MRGSWPVIRAQGSMIGVANRERATASAAFVQHDDVRIPLCRIHVPPLVLRSSE